MEIMDYANEICEFLLQVPEIKNCYVVGSLSNGDSDEYSDIDIEIDVSGIDNGKFLTKIPDIFAQKYNIIFSDYAPSLAPEIYVVSLAISEVNPFMVVDIRCFASPHISTLSKKDISSLNNLYEHTLKLFTANLKHFIRGQESFNDIERMHNRILEKRDNADESLMFSEVYNWLRDNATDKHIEYLRSLKQYL